METEEFGALLEYAFKRALNSAVECHPHTVEVIGSNPIAPTTHRFLDFGCRAWLVFSPLISVGIPTETVYPRFLSVAW